MMPKNEQKPQRIIQKEISILKAEFRSTELRPCYGDADLMKKDSDLASLRQEIYRLEKEVNQFAVYIPCLRSRMY